MVGLDGGWAARPSRREWGWGEGPSLAITAMSCVAFTYVFRLSVSIREVDSVLYTHIHEFLCMSHLSYFIYFPVTHTKNQNQNKTKQVENENQKKEKIKRSRRRKEEPNVRST